MKSSKSIFKKYIAVPQDHGSWVFILTPLVVGLCAGGKFSAASFSLVIAALVAFLIRQPITIAIKAYSGRRSRTELPAARRWVVIYGVLLILSISELVILGNTYVLYLAIPALPVFSWHLWLVSRHEERGQGGVEILATGVLALAAPAAFWIGKGGYDPLGWLLWLLTWIQSSASIVYVYLRLDQRKWVSHLSVKQHLSAGCHSLGFSFFNLILVLLLSLFTIIPAFVWFAFLIQALETIWGTFHPAVQAKPFSVGIRQLLVTTLFTIVFVLTWR